MIIDDEPATRVFNIQQQPSSNKNTNFLKEKVISNLKNNRIKDNSPVYQGVNGTFFYYTESGCRHYLNELEKRRIEKCY